MLHVRPGRTRAPGCCQQSPPVPHERGRTELAAVRHQELDAAHSHRPGRRQVSVSATCMCTLFIYLFTVGCFSSVTRLPVPVNRSRFASSTLFCLLFIVTNISVIVHDSLSHVEIEGRGGSVEKIKADHLITGQRCLHFPPISHLSFSLFIDSFNLR